VRISIARYNNHWEEVTDDERGRHTFFRTLAYPRQTVSEDKTFKGGIFAFGEGGKNLVEGERPKGRG